MCGVVYFQQFFGFIKFDVSYLSLLRIYLEIKYFSNQSCKNFLRGPVNLVKRSPVFGFFKS